MLASYGKANYRKLTKAEADEAEQVKFGVLCALPLFSDVTPELITTCLQVDNPITDDIKENLFDLISSFASESGRELTIEEVRRAQILSYVEINLEEIEE